uniref:disease resistance protein RPV1-like isoform X2 n=1 Tax=Erigeron canadensis TaxID=72917 RepID=UPI001CB8C5D6|nr:disease resistance protein RPV1-like isoform X2 [Erigeron canadensis]
MTTGHPSFSYDVFLSFRGEDTRTTFTDHLYAALTQAGIRTFRDDDAMDRGRLLGPELNKAIRESAISIIVFSRNYASSKWCLDEVLTIIGEQERISSKHEVVPVFYKVEPSDVRNQTGSFAEAFGGYDDMIEAETDLQKKNELLEKVKAWRDSLRKAGSLTGMVLTANGHEAEFIGKVVSVIRTKLNCKLLYIEEKLVGIEKNVAEIESWLQDPSPNAVFLFIHGMGGIGKTTISKCIYNSNYHEYGGSCFLADIHQTSKQPNGLLRLQTQLLSTLLKSNKEELIWNLDEGVIKVTNALHNKKVLLILDDISTRQQLATLLGPQQFHHGSKVIVTTRHKGLFKFFEVNPKVLAIQELDPYDALKLFSLYAFHRDHPIEPYILQSNLVVHHCRGLPLALKVLGSFLYGMTLDVWEDAMRKLEAVPNQEIQKVLQLSFDTLDDTKDKDLFLHIACFFVGEDKDFIVKLLAECDLYPVVGIKNLIDRCLLYIEDGRVMMHQLIKEMGQEVVRQESPKHPGRRSRLWHHQDSFNVLNENEGTKKVEGLALDMQKIKEFNSTSIVKMNSGRKRSYEDFSGYTNKENFKVGAIEKMKNLMLLQLDYATFSGSYKKLPKKLRLLRWHGFPLKSIPGDVPLQKLVVLDLRYSKLKELWDGYKVSFEFGIFTTYVSGKTLPCFRYKETGSTVSFRVPSHPNGSRTSGLNVCFMSTSNSDRPIISDVEVNNKTKVLVWKYNPTVQVRKRKCMSNYVWLSLWRIGNLLDDGDEIVVTIRLLGSDIVGGCSVELVYDDDNEVGEDNQEEINEERKDTHGMSNHISWTDRLQVEISDYVHSGKTYCFKIGGPMDVPYIDGISDLHVDWWGLRADWRCRRVLADSSLLLQVPYS